MIALSRKRPARKITQRSSEICKPLIIKPVKRNNNVIKLSNKNFIQCENIVYEIGSNCNSVHEIKICKRDNLLEIVEHCSLNLLHGLPASCTIKNAHHIEIVKQITHGLILLNELNGTINK